MSMVRVYNDNIYEHREEFRGVEVIIPSKGFVEMNRDDAVLFKSQFTPILKGRGGIDDPRGFKMLRIEFDPGKPEVEDIVGKVEVELSCQACDFKAQSKAGLAAHIRARHSQQMVDTDAREAIENEA